MGGLSTRAIQSTDEDGERRARSVCLASPCMIEKQILQREIFSDVFETFPRALVSRLGINGRIEKSD
jgi:hypothetical protein